MKKILSIFLCVVIVLTSVAILGSAADDSLPFIVASDLHYVPTPNSATMRFPEEKYYCAYEVATLSAESNAIIRQFLREAAASDAEFLLLCGDLTEDGSMQQHRNMAAMLSDFETKTGKKVFVIDGNHDFHNGITIQNFKDTYKALGYDEALAVDPATCSYTVDLNSQYRLLALDSCRPGYGADGITEELLNWANEQAEIAKKDGKTLIAMMHHGFLDHLKFQSLILPEFLVRSTLNMQARFLHWGVRYVFTGHFHGQDIASYSDAANKTVYDIMTTSLSAYPCAYRTCTLKPEGLQTDTTYIQGVDAKDLPRSGYTEELLRELTEDLNTFADGCFRVTFNRKKDRYFGKDSLRNIFSKFGGQPVQNLIDTCYPEFYENLCLPIYTKDAEDSRSLQAIGEKLGLQFRATENKKVWDSLYYFVSIIYCGDENVPYNDNEIVLFMQCVYTALYDAMRTVHAEQREALLSDIHNSFKSAALPFAVTGAAQAALGTVKNDRLLESVLLMMAPIIEMYSVDEDTPDNSAFLPANSEKAPFVVWFRHVFEQIAKFVRRFFRGWISIYFPKVLPAA